MGVSIFIEQTSGRRLDVTPGWRSKLHSMLLDNGLYGHLDRGDIPRLCHLALCQRLEEEKMPWAWSGEIAEKCFKIVRYIERCGSATVWYEH